MLIFHEALLYEHIYLFNSTLHKWLFLNLGLNSKRKQSFQFWQRAGRQMEAKPEERGDVILLRSVMLPLLASHHRLPYSIDICVFFFPTMQKMMLLKTEAMSSSALHLQVPPIAFCLLNLFPNEGINDSIEQ